MVRGLKIVIFVFFMVVGSFSGIGRLVLNCVFFLSFIMENFK